MGVVGVKGQYTVGPFVSRGGGSTNLASILPASFDVDQSFKFTWKGPDDVLKCSGQLIWVVNSSGSSSKPVTDGDSVELRYRGNQLSGEGRDSPHDTVIGGDVGNESEPAIRSYSTTVNVNPAISFANKNMAFTGVAFLVTAKKVASSDMNSWAYVYGTALGPRGDSEAVSYRVDGGGWKTMPSVKTKDHVIRKGQEIQLRCSRSGAVDETEVGDIYTISYNIGTSSGDATITITSINLGRDSLPQSGGLQ
jgi:hypothetical protein